MERIENEIKRLNEQIASLQKEQKVWESMPANKKLAEVIFNVTNENSGRKWGWSLESWDSPGMLKTVYLKRADDILEENSFEDAMKILKHLY